jgi:hypothetical protein
VYFQLITAIFQRVWTPNPSFFKSRFMFLFNIRRFMINRITGDPGTSEFELQKSLAHRAVRHFCQFFHSQYSVLCAHDI